MVREATQSSSLFLFWGGGVTKGDFYVLWAKSLTSVFSSVEGHTGVLKCENHNVTLNYKVLLAFSRKKTEMFSIKRLRFLCPLL